MLKKQRRANIVPPPWLHPESLKEIIRREKADPTKFSAPPPPPSRPRRGAPGLAARVNANHTDQALPLSPPFLPSCTADAPAGYLPYHWHEVAETLLAYAGDDVASLGGGANSGAGSGEVRSLLRDLAEVRAAKLRGGTAQLESLGLGGGVVALSGAGAMEVAESRGFVLGVVDGLRRLGAAEELQRREEEEEGGGGLGGGEESDEEMGLE